MLASSRMTGRNGGTQRTIYVSLRRDEGIPPYKYDLCAACSAKAAGTQCPPTVPAEQKYVLFLNESNHKLCQPNKKLCLTHQQGGREKSRPPCFVLFTILIIQRSYTHRGCGSASSSCRGTFRQCRTQLPSPAHAWPCWDRTSTRQYRRGGAGQ